MLDYIPHIGARESQVILTVTLVVATAMLALFCDVIRYRTWRSRVVEDPAGRSAKAASRVALAPTLVPEIEHHHARKVVLPSERGSRLVSALKLPHRSLSPGAAAAIARGVEATQYSKFPIGYQPHAVLKDLISEGRRFTGFALAVRVTDDNGPGPGLLRNIAHHLIGNDGFVAPVGNRNHILLIPGLSGRQSQDRMRNITEYLRDTQVRTMTTYGSSFLWSIVDVDNETLERTIELAVGQVDGRREHRKSPKREHGRRRHHRAG